MLTYGSVHSGVRRTHVVVHCKHEWWFGKIAIKPTECVVKRCTADTHTHTPNPSPIFSAIFDTHSVSLVNNLMCNFSYFLFQHFRYPDDNNIIPSQKATSEYSPNKSWFVNKFTTQNCLLLSPTHWRNYFLFYFVYFFVKNKIWTRKLTLVWWCGRIEKNSTTTKSTIWSVGSWFFCCRFFFFFFFFVLRVFDVIWMCNGINLNCVRRMRFWYISVERERHTHYLIYTHFFRVFVCMLVCSIHQWVNVAIFSLNWNM